MGLVTDLLKVVKRPRGGIPDAETALRRLTAEREAAQHVIDSATERRRALLLGDASDAEILAVEREADAARLQLERLDLLEPKLLEHLQALRDAESRQRWAEFLRRHEEAAEAFDAAAVALMEKTDALLATFKEAGDGGFGDEVRHTFASPPTTGGGAVLVSRETLNSFRQRRERSADAAKVLPTEPAAPAAPPAVKAVLKSVGHGMVSTWPEPAPHREPRPVLKLEGQAPDGHLAVRYIYPGVELPGGGQSRTGDEVYVPAEIARRLAENGAADLIATSPEGDRA